MPDPFAPVTSPMSLPSAAADAPTRPLPPIPWIVNEDREAWPEEVAHGTWREVYPYPQYEEGPLKITSKLHFRHLDVVHMGLKSHMERRRKRTGQPFALYGDPELMSHTGRVRRPDLALYLQDPDHDAPVPAKHHFDVREDGPPDLVMEFLSRSTWLNDVGDESLPAAADKKRYYATMGIQEYWIVNPHLEDLAFPLLQGFRLDPVRAVYVPIPPDADGFWPSAVLETRWGVDHAQWVRLWNPDRGTWYRVEGWEDALSQAEAKKAALQQANVVREQATQTQIAQVMEVAVHYGSFTPSQRDTYREALGQMVPDRIPNALDFLPHLLSQPEGQARHEATIAYLRNALGRDPDTG